MRQGDAHTGDFYGNPVQCFSSAPDIFGLSYTNGINIFDNIHRPKTFFSILRALTPLFLIGR